MMKLAGVAPSTVTRHPKQITISDETKKRVRKAMVELDYHPTLMLVVLSANLVKSLL